MLPHVLCERLVGALEAFGEEARPHLVGRILRVARLLLAIYERNGAGVVGTREDPAPIVGPVLALLADPRAAGAFPVPDHPPYGSPPVVQEIAQLCERVAAIYATGEPPSQPHWCREGGAAAGDGREALA